MKRGSFVRLQVVIWAVYAVMHFVATLPAVQDGQAWDLAQIKIVRALGGFLITLVLPPVYNRVLSARWRPAVIAALAAMSAFVLGNLWLILDRTLLALTRGLWPMTVDWGLFPRGFDLDYALAILVWNGGYVAFWHWRETSRRQEELLRARIVARDSQLEALRLQLSPHFLFNTLNSLRGLIAEDQDRAREMVTRLASFLRHSLTAKAVAPLAEEIALAEAYLEIERLRFDGALEAAFGIGIEATKWLVPALILQPAIENALKYGTPDEAGRRQLRVSATTGAEGLQIKIANTGTLIRDAPPGVGLTNMRARLAQFSGGGATLALEEQQGWVSAIIVIPEGRNALADGSDSR